MNMPGTRPVRKTRSRVSSTELPMEEQEKMEWDAEEHKAEGKEEEE